jgi:hypothetical protein
VIGAGLNESVPGPVKRLQGRFVSLFDSQLRVRRTVDFEENSRWFLLDLDAAQKGHARVLASACRTVPLEQTSKRLRLKVEGVAETEALVLVHSPRKPKSVLLAGKPHGQFEYSPTEKLLWISFPNEAAPRELGIEF